MTTVFAEQPLALSGSANYSSKLPTCLTVKASPFPYIQPTLYIYKSGLDINIAGVIQLGRELVLGPVATTLE